MSINVIETGHPSVLVFEKTVFIESVVFIVPEPSNVALKP